MDVKLGWSGEVYGSWTKMDVTVEEVDLLTLLADHKLVETSLTALEKFKLMFNMAETFVQIHKMTKFPNVFGDEDNKNALKELVSNQNRLLESLKDKAPF